MSFLAPLFFLGLAAIAVPILVHLIQRERKHVIQFPSLMFVRRIPYQSVRRRRIRHWFLLLMRAAAIALHRRGVRAAVLPAGRGRRGGRRRRPRGRRSCSISRRAWATAITGRRRARRAATRSGRSAPSDTRHARALRPQRRGEHARDADRGRLEAALNAAKVTSGATRYGPALKLAESILARSTLPRREAILISDFQRTGWSGAEDVHFGEGITLTPVSVGVRQDRRICRCRRSTFARAIVLRPGAHHGDGRRHEHGRRAGGDVPVVARDRRPRQIETQSVTIAAERVGVGRRSHQFTLAEPAVRGIVRAGIRRAAADNTFHFVLDAEPAVSVLVIDSGDRGDSSFYPVEGARHRQRARRSRSRSSRRARHASDARRSDRSSS